MQYVQFHLRPSIAGMVIYEAILASWAAFAMGWACAISASLDHLIVLLLSMACCAASAVLPMVSSRVLVSRAVCSACLSKDFYIRLCWRGLLRVFVLRVSRYGNGRVRGAFDTPVARSGQVFEGVGSPRPWFFCVHVARLACCPSNFAARFSRSCMVLMKHLLRRLRRFRT
jgi:hypothetical protein